ncbi:gas vesicle protein GvpG [Dolichospermum circinale CS-1225]|uniref:Gas vesicle protein GvpG n=1 Tax=Dolichospermum circinale CS-537/01 TaxID=3021739 RepID=A0ABT5A014_9CYAN|nr:gas vesicle protein GvpG [Dolichospermum circinale]MDB9456851.1 gas vesicle protein GvpG [Dolichospermum circinale CS-545/17]MDB9468370.1 gas vesicle protein GvpG [Dolichospermum circinale CS-539/09]MDB9471909.1 gas vesicle protein GvpG [Dolichospermum circinale CS-539]MDB9485266.1 gas vesicle protein GvpG [Dolichospermum circinale CS-537/01]MDB9523238.1 gas vesicle protein GvpG [Dolichospermum circinale CS-1225]
MLTQLLLLPIMGPLNGVVWIAEQIQERTNTEFDAQENLHKQLLSLQLSFDIGEISEEEFEIQEEEILLKIQALEEEARLELEAEQEQARLELETEQEQAPLTLEVEQDEFENPPLFTRNIDTYRHLVTL